MQINMTPHERLELNERFLELFTFRPQSSMGVPYGFDPYYDLMYHEIVPPRSLINSYNLPNPLAK